MCKMIHLLNLSRQENGVPKREIRFFRQLTLLVAAVSQSFPSAQISPHVLCYNFFLQRITQDVFLARLGGGGVALLVTSHLCVVAAQSQLSRKYPREAA